MTLLINDPRQKFFKDAMTKLLVAREFFEIHLPDALLKEINLASLTLEKHSFIEEEYKATETDVIYSVRAGEGTVYLCIIYKSQAPEEGDHPMAFRLLGYKLRIMEMHRERFPKSRLPIVFPIVIYSGEKPWNETLDIFSLYGDAKDDAKKWMFKPQVVNVSREEHEAFKNKAPGYNKDSMPK